MHPILFEIHGFPIGTYALMALLALALGVSVFSGLAARDGRPRVAFIEMGLWAFIVALASSKVFGMLVAFRNGDWRDNFVQVLRYGGHYYIGFLAGVAFLVFALRQAGVLLPRGLDYLAPGLALAHGVGKIGCFLAGCCWGAQCELPWAVTFTSQRAHELTGVPLGVPLHPTQLYEAGGELLIGVLLLLKQLRAPWRAGSTFLAYLVAYGTLRVIVEGLRNDPRGHFLGMPTSQPLAIGSVLVGVAGLLALTRWQWPGTKDGADLERPARVRARASADPADVETRRRPPKKGRRGRSSRA